MFDRIHVLDMGSMELEGTLRATTKLRYATSYTAYVTTVQLYNRSSKHDTMPYAHATADCQRSLDDFSL